MKEKAILQAEVKFCDRETKENREIEITLQRFKDNKLTAQEEDFIIESELERIREQREEE